MSLINQALRKAQQDRSPGNRADPGPNQPVGTMPDSSSRSMQPGFVVGLIALVALLIGLVAGLSVVLLKGDSTKPPAVATAEPEAASVPAPADDDPSPPQPDTESTSTAILPINPTAAGSPRTPDQSEARVAENPSALMDELRHAREAAEAKIQAEAQAEIEAEAEVETDTSAIVEWLTESRISGVRLSSTNSKVILNGEAYAEGEYVNFQLGLRVIRIEEERVLFSDESGKRYMKRI